MSRLIWHFLAYVKQSLFWRDPHLFLVRQFEVCKGFLCDASTGWVIHNEGVIEGVEVVPEKGGPVQVSLMT